MVRDFNPTNNEYDRRILFYGSLYENILVFYQNQNTFLDVILMICFILNRLRQIAF